MLSLLFEKLADPRSVVALFIGVVTVASLLVIAMPYLEGDNLDERMKSVAVERERIRAREREKMMAKTPGKQGLRHSSKTYMKDIVERFSLSKWLATEEAKASLARAGFRGPQAEIGFLFFRLVTPIGLTLVGSLYAFVVLQLDMAFLQKFAVVVGLLYVGLKAPEIYLSNTIQKRQHEMRRAFPDALDLLLICVESGMSVEHGFRRVSQEIGVRSIALAEEFTLTTAELSYLPDRRTAYDNFYQRTGLDDVKNVVTSLVQAEKYGTPLGAALRTVSQEARDNRMMEAEKKAASLPPKLTVPMILCFLPVLFAVIMTPAVMQVTGAQ
ncbi:tight adherence protein C [Rhodoblastus acidophilus]|uniref:Tight adherence protein C n=1 Tax=Rhodoblastus acidophilus TaxID=1074 RepID=A0A212R1Y0_RHOAC|nr:type II secretion system F family protein [Rhodoblastus acidophilus]MCW2314642.1 tight adherence protein C [Rhodoblastus acidophilus]PPQ40343.1 type II secretion system protein [Rhodoblastus acidophilus]RAI16398.1 type II secretion system protein [Rhodoblastus acidophilus]SNB66005.1 tight adherence protein C [Rhodoblastus acidophilus]